MCFIHREVIMPPTIGAHLRAAPLLLLLFRPAGGRSLKNFSRRAGSDPRSPVEAAWDSRVAAF